MKTQKRNAWRDYQNRYDGVSVNSAVQSGDCVLRLQPLRDSCNRPPFCPFDQSTTFNSCCGWRWKAINKLATILRPQKSDLLKLMCLYIGLQKEQIIYQQKIHLCIISKKKERMWYNISYCSPYCPPPPPPPHIVLIAFTSQHLANALIQSTSNRHQFKGLTLTLVVVCLW